MEKHYHGPQQRTQFMRSSRCLKFAAAVGLSILPIDMTLAQSTYDCETLKATACTHTAGDAVTSATVYFNAPRGNCSGTLLATTDASSSSQLILTAAHCFALPNGTPPTSYSTTIYYQALGSCVSGNSSFASVTTAARSSLAATVELVMFDSPRSESQPDGSTIALGSDTALIRVPVPPPRGTYFAAWDASALPDGVAVELVGHGASLQSSYLLGQTETESETANPDKLSVVGSEGITVSGHSGGGAYRLSGQLVGIISGASCRAIADSSSPAGYLVGIGRFSTVYDLAKSYLDPNSTGATSATGYYVPARPEVTLSVQGGTSFSGTVGQTATLSWTSSSDVTSCSATGGWSGSKRLSGSESVLIQSGSTTYTLSCSNSVGPTSKSVTITGIAPTPPSSSGGGVSSGGGSTDLDLLIGLLLLATYRRKIRTQGGSDRLAVPTTSA